MEEARVKAIVDGKKWYESRWACKEGHIGRRYACNGSCVKCTIQHATNSYKKGAGNGSGSTVKA